MILETKYTCKSKVTNFDNILYKNIIFMPLQVNTIIFTINKFDNDQTPYKYENENE